jgi:hypothetical protein
MVLKKIYIIKEPWGFGGGAAVLSHENRQFLKAFERAGTGNSLILELSRKPQNWQLLDFWIFFKELEITDGYLILDLLQRT